MAGERYEVPPQRLGRWLERWAQRHDGVGATEITAAGARFTGGDGAVLLCEAPFPPVEPGARGRRDGFAPGPLLEHVARERRVGVLLVRRGGYAAGVFAGRELVDSKVGRRRVHGRHKAGGWSQQRFARRRDNEVRAALGDAVRIAERVLVPAAGGLDAVVTGGDRAALETVLDEPALAALRPLVVERVLDVPEPRLAVLQATPDAFTATVLRLE